VSLVRALRLDCGLRSVGKNSPVRTLAGVRNKVAASGQTSQRSIVELLRALVRTPSRSGVDSYDKVFDTLGEWLSARRVPFDFLNGQDGRRVALYGTTLGNDAAPAYVLNATVDTAGFGDIETWSHGPTAAATRDGWLFGRGSADSKAGLAIFCHLLAAFANNQGSVKSLGFVFDADEHRGSFTGIKAFVNQYGMRVAGVMIGYPGLDSIMVGARGFWRATLRIHGEAAHSGASTRRGSNAIAKAAELVRMLRELHEQVAAASGAEFPLAPAVTVTGISGGGDYSRSMCA
jgi:succinyl-diaminopimelate desuccinylase